MCIRDRRQLDTVMGESDFNKIYMNSTHTFILDSIKDQPIGETVHFVWFITDIGIAALFKKKTKNSKFLIKMLRTRLKILA